MPDEVKLKLYQCVSCWAKVSHSLVPTICPICHLGATFIVLNEDYQYKEERKDEREFGIPNKP